MIPDALKHKHNRLSGILKCIALKIQIPPQPEGDLRTAVLWRAFREMTMSRQGRLVLNSNKAPSNLESQEYIHDVLREERGRPKETETLNDT